MKKHFCILTVIIALVLLANCISYAETLRLSDVWNYSEWKKGPQAVSNGEGLLGDEIRKYLLEYGKRKYVPVIGGKELSGSWRQETYKMGVAFITADISEAHVLQALSKAFGTPMNLGNDKNPEYAIPAFKAGASIWVSKEDNDVVLCVLKPYR